MKFSVLLPTRDREELLKYAVQSVINQTYSDWELIISDNGSSQKEISWLTGCSDKRIRYFKQPHVLSVTENWNFAQNRASGEYFLMIGDDDALLPDALANIAERLTQHGNIEVLVYPCYIWQQKSVSITFPEGYLLRSQSASIEREGSVEKSLRHTWLEDVLAFKGLYGYNMQYYCYGKNFVKRLQQYGDVYEPPYPDYYFSVMMLYLADNVYFIDRPLCIIGVTSKSYGWYYLNNLEKRGMEFHKEADYRERACEKIRRLLVSIDEMDTAAFVSFNLAVERLGLSDLDIMAYYRAVIKRKVYNCPLLSICHFMQKEMFPNVLPEQRKDLIDWLMYYVKCQTDESEIHYFSNVYPSHFHIDYDNILEVINDDAHIVSKKLLSSSKEQVDHPVNPLQSIKTHRLYEWLQRIDRDSLYRILRGRKVLIRGASKRGKIIKDFLLNLGVTVEGYIDKDKTRKFLDSLPIHAPDIINKNVSKYYVICSIGSVCDSILEEFAEAGYEYMRDFAYVNYNPRIKVQNYMDIFGNRVYCQEKRDELYVEFLGRDETLKVDSNYVAGNIVMQGNGAFLQLRENYSQVEKVNVYCRGCGELANNSRNAYLTIIDRPNEIFDFVM